jgi:L-aminopeptidase/D-esterase-like protein
MALGVDGVRIGTWTAPSGRSGCTVLLPPEGSVGALAVRGAAPGTREAAALGPSGKVSVCHGVVLAGGSAFGLAAADGVVRWCEEQGIGYPVAVARVPIVGAAIVLDAAVADPSSRPDARAGHEACRAATEEDPAEGSVGVGAGCTIAKVGGLEHAWRGGQGISVQRAAGVTVAALAANNAVGELRDDDGAWIARARVPDDAPRYPEHGGTLLGGPPGRDDDPTVDGPGGPRAVEEGPTTNTVVGAVVTDAALTRRDAHRVADLAHSGVARAVWPAHTDADGDALFCLATGRVEATVDLVAHLAAVAVADAVRRGPMAATAREGLPGLADPRP